MKDEKDLKQLPDELLASVNGGISMEDQKATLEYYFSARQQRLKGEIDDAEFNAIMEQISAYCAYASRYEQSVGYTESVRFDKNIDWVGMIKSIK
ncbi:MAG: hypothetical protein ACI4QI_04085 [Candidatus Coproplasma sp.]